MKSFLFPLFLFLHCSLFGQMNGAELLQKSIQYHDPQGEWAEFQGMFFFEFENTEGLRKPSTVLIDLPNHIFRQVDGRKEKEIVRFEGRDTCYATMGGRADFSAEDAEKFRLRCADVQMYRDYYTYLYGLPMKLTDPGAIIQEKVIDTTFFQEKYLAIKVMYEPEVGDEIWFFYFDPTTYALKAYQFYRDEESKKGEVILLSAEYRYRNLRIPRHRSWYVFPDIKFLGTDRLEKIE